MVATCGNGPRRPASSCHPRVRVRPENHRSDMMSEAIARRRSSADRDGSCPVSRRHNFRVGRAEKGAENADERGTLALHGLGPSSSGSARRESSTSALYTDTVNVLDASQLQGVVDCGARLISAAFFADAESGSDCRGRNRGVSDPASRPRTHPTGCLRIAHATVPGSGLSRQTGVVYEDTQDQSFRTDGTPRHHARRAPDPNRFDASKWCRVIVPEAV
jgi:hypothetical protein